MKILHVTDTHHTDESTEAIHRSFWKEVQEKESFDAIAHTGDWGRTSLDQVKDSFRIIRESVPDKPIWSVTGNHCLWDTRSSLSLESRIDQIQKYALNYGIDLVERNPLETEKFFVVGLMGWYKNPQTGTRDREFLPPYTSEGTPYVWLQKYAFQSFTEILDMDFKGKKVLFLSHFPLVKEIMDRVDLSGDYHMGPGVLDIADVYCFGHTHQSLDQVIGKTRIINAGADYDQKPRYKIFELK